MKNLKLKFLIIVFLAAIFILPCFLISCDKRDDEIERPAVEDDDYYDDDDSGNDDDSLDSGDDELLPPNDHDPPQWGAAFKVGSGKASAPSIKIFDQNAEVTYFEPETGKSPSGHLNYQRFPLDGGNPTDPVYVAADAYYADWFYEDDKSMTLLGARPTQVIILTGDSDGQNWDQRKAIANSNSHLCPGNLPVVAGIFPGEKGSKNRFAHFTYNYNTGIIGCAPTTYLAPFNSMGQWGVEIASGGGRATGLFQMGQDPDKMLMVSSFGVSITEDGGATTKEIPGGDYTKNQVRGKGAVKFTDGSFRLVTEFNYADKYNVSIVRGDKNGGNWISPFIVLAQTDNIILYPRIGAYKDKIMVIWLESSFKSGDKANYPLTPYYRFSVDGGKTWTGKHVIKTGPGESVTELYLAVNNDYAAIFYMVGETGYGNIGQLYLQIASLD